MTQGKEIIKQTVYEKITLVQGELATAGISKDRKTKQSFGANYSFRGIDDVYNVLAPLLAKHGLCILPRVISRECAERKSNKGGNLFYTTLHMEFDFVSSSDGSKHTVSVYGEAMDSGDKSTNKAMSAGYKYACLQTFCIPTEGDNDPDATVHQVAPKAETKPEPKAEILDPKIIAEVKKYTDDKKLLAYCAKTKLTLSAYQYKLLVAEYQKQRAIIIEENKTSDIPE